jgi:hypothetical protein
MKEYQYSIDLPHAAARIWTLMNDYHRWAEFAKPMVIGVSVAEPGDEIGNGLVRHVRYRLPLGLKGTSVETISDVELGVGYTYTAESGTVGKLRLEELGPESTRMHFEESLRLKWPLIWFEGRIQKFIADHSRKTMLKMADWLTEHPEYAASSG